MIDCAQVTVSDPQKRAISVDVARLSVSARTRQRLNQFFKTKAFSKTELAKACGKEPSWVSAFLHPSSDRSSNPTIHLDDLDNVASYFRISIGELLGAAKPGELSGDEQRVVYAFRALPPTVQDHFLGLIELASLAPRQMAQQRLHTESKRDIRTEPQPFALRGGSHGRPVSPDPAVALRETQAFLTDVAHQLGDAAAGTIPDRQISSARPDETQTGRLAD